MSEVNPNYYSLLTTHYSLLTTHYSLLLTTHYSPFINPPSSPNSQSLAARRLRRTASSPRRKCLDRTH
ncbi:hypothetical protein FJW07_12240 [Mesorhizobium sp. B3-1-9]|nr:hypothetical protein FJW07_12240 [Mesorhizobium sp. B3-1-9]